MSVSKWRVKDSEIAELLSLSEYSGQWVRIAQKLLDTTESRRANKDVENLADYVRKNARRLTDSYEGVRNHAEVLDIDLTTVKDGWLKHKAGSFRFINKDFIDPESKTSEIDFLSIFKDKVEPVKITLPQANLSGLFDRLVYSDTHIGMEPNKDGFALYDGVWDESEIDRRLSIVVNFTLQNQKSDVLLIHDLGDFMDGWDGFTTRGGHKLPQNMDNQKAFDIGFGFKVKMIDALIQHYKSIECVNITNDNHGGSFSYTVNSAFKAYTELKYSNVKVTNQRKFMDHYAYDGVTFVLTHGKDATHMKHGFKPNIDPAQIAKISSYIDANRLTGKIEFCKGDSHQFLINKSIKKFQYWNFFAMSPPSDWVKTNFDNSDSGFVVLNYFKGREPIINDYIF